MDALDVKLKSVMAMTDTLKKHIGNHNKKEAHAHDAKSPGPDRSPIGHPMFGGIVKDIMTPKATKMNSNPEEDFILFAGAGIAANKGSESPASSVLNKFKKENANDNAKKPSLFGRAEQSGSETPKK